MPSESTSPELTDPSVDSSTSTSTGTDSASGETAPMANAREPASSLQSTFEVILTGTISFEHEVGGSPCPQSAGKVSVELSNGHSLLVSDISVSGDLASRLDISVAGNMITGLFNCSSSSSGEFKDTVTGKATDQTNGTSKSFSFLAYGYVSG